MGYWVIIPAAGVGKRMGQACPKQYLTLESDTILDTTIGKFIDHPEIIGVVVGISDGDEYWPASRWSTHPCVHVFAGGRERSDTVLNGLLCLKSLGVKEDDFVLVHDAARPLLPENTLNNLLADNCPEGAILALPARDTLKQSMDAEVISATLDRRHVWQAQTPQKFPYKALMDALVQAQQEQAEITDESSALERMGWRPALVEGHPMNLKVTVPADLELLRAHLHYQAYLHANVNHTSENKTESN